MFFLKDAEYRQIDRPQVQQLDRNERWKMIQSIQKIH